MGVRLFLGVPLPSDLTRSLITACDVIRSSDPAWRDAKWVAKSNIHLTLAFLGEVEVSDISDLSLAFSRVATEHRRFSLPFGGLRAMPSERRCRMLWAAFLDPDGACEALAEDLLRAAEPFCEVERGRSFRAHATLCRARRPKPLNAAAIARASEFLRDVPPEMSVPSATLFESRLTPQGPVYTERGVWPLEEG